MNIVIKKTVQLSVCFLVFISLFCQGSQNSNQSNIEKRARELAHEILILDSHIDVPYRLLEEYEDISQRTEKGHFDYPRAIEGGLDVAFFAIYVRPDLQKKGGAKASADLQIDMVYKIIEANPDKFVLITSPAEISQKLQPGKIGIALGIENGAALEGKMENLLYFYNKGIRYITLAHSKWNRICDSSYDEERRWNGLSPFGKALVKEMNNIGMMIDVAHVSDEAFYQVLELSRSPVIASHSAVRHFTPGFERNLDDQMINLMAQGEGIVQVPFGSYFIHPEMNRVGEQVRKSIDNYLIEHNLTSDDSQAVAYSRNIRAENRVDPGDIELLLNQIDHIVQLQGVNFVGFGSDFDGVGKVPRGLEDVSAYPNIIRELLKRGYKESDIRKICAENFLRVWSEIEQTAKKVQ
ncbi:MAG: dipeptidase [Calditrichia bacterium]|nr:dipeptidase [Calditrichia bacterium]